MIEALLQSAKRLRVTLCGAVQGVGFRPFVYHLATGMDLKGWVQNTPEGVLIEVEGPGERLETFLCRLQSEKPERAIFQSVESSFLDPAGEESFEIRESENEGEPNTVVLPDIAACPECVREIFDPENRRHLYPFTNCTHCGPRFSIVEGLPYDRQNTTMKKFKMCRLCREEYENPDDRRFHAQPNACPACGPELEFWDARGRAVASQGRALDEAVGGLCRGEIVAVKGIGGFQLMVDASNEKAICLLRKRKHREAKPFALMFPSLSQVREICQISAAEERLFLSPESPIVLVKRKKNFTAGRVADSAAPGNPYLGIMLPTTPLHHLLLQIFGGPVVATSGNLSEEPMVTDEGEVLKRLEEIADFFLVHNRPIARPVDDSVVRIMAGREMVIRRARGYAPLPIHVKKSAPSLIAFGGHLKSTIALSRHHQVVLSQHLGDLDSVETFEAFKQAEKDLKALYRFSPRASARDLHPDYRSSRYADSSGLPTTPVQHHLAHVLACAAENEVEGSFLGVAWDGTGYGPDGTIWGGEFFSVSPSAYERTGSFRSFPLPGGEQAIREPRRTAVALLYEIFGDAVFNMKDLNLLHSFSSEELKNLETMLVKNLQTPRTSSAGRLFDGVSALVGCSLFSRFEGEAAMRLEFALEEFDTEEVYSHTLLTAEGPTRTGSPKARYRINWAPMLFEILEDMKKGLPAGMISAKFHNTLAEMIAALAETLGEEKVVLSGGCFQNKYLTERTISLLRQKSFHPYWHRRVPPNDGGIALGQAVAAAQPWAQKEGLE